jgi:peroxiredoxin Q/BCP
VILGCSTDSVEKNKRFAEKYGFRFSLLCDTDRKIGLAYDAVDGPAGSAKRMSYLIGPDGKIKKVWPFKSVVVGTHPSEMLAAIG